MQTFVNNEKQPGIASALPFHTCSQSVLGSPGYGGFDCPGKQAGMEFHVLEMSTFPSFIG